MITNEERKEAGSSWLKNFATKHSQLIALGILVAMIVFLIVQGR